MGFYFLIWLKISENTCEKWGRNFDNVVSGENKNVSAVKTDVLLVIKGHLVDENVNHSGLCLQPK